MIISNLILIVVLVALNGFFVGVEFAVVAARRTRIELLAREGNRGAAIVRDWLEDSKKRDRLVAAAQLGITIVSLALGIVGENTFEAILAPLFHNMTLPAGYQFLGAVIAATPIVLALIITTSLHVVLGEQVPKVAALYSPERFALVTARPMRVFTQVFRLFVDILDWATRKILALFGLQAVGGHLVYSKEEIKQIVSDSERNGLITEPGGDLLHAVLEFGELIVRQVMIPRTEIIAVQADQSFDEMIELLRKQSITKLPVYEDDLDQIMGILHVKDLLRLLGSDECADFTARQLAQEPIFVPEALPVNALLDRFRAKRQHIAIVLDEFGGTAGLVTLEDLIEEIVGEVSDPYDSPVPEIHTLPSGVAMIDGLVQLEDVNEVLELELLDQNYDTIAGYVLGKLGRIPAVGDVVIADGVKLTVESMDHLRIERLSLERLEIHPDKDVGDKDRDG